MDVPPDAPGAPEQALEEVFARTANRFTAPRRGARARGATELVYSLELSRAVADREVLDALRVIPGVRQASLSRSLHAQMV